ncbi:MAG TPA: LuxR C-terminal-related transcriptional regulator [Ktedonobacterales bacterium]
MQRHEVASRSWSVGGQVLGKAAVWRGAKVQMTAMVTHPSNLPAQVSSFIGREHELAEITDLLRSHRLITLTGPGGAGKTRLALQAARAEVGSFRDGVSLVELASITVPDLVCGSIMKAVSAPETGADSPLDTLSLFLSSKQLLLVLDNCEHLLNECAQVVAHLLARCPDLTVLTTSRESLGIGGERVLRVPPLDLPAPSASLTLDELLAFDGVRLFVERARAAEPSFRFTEVSATPVVDICRRLDGIPLALELAAVRVRGMGVAYLEARLDDRFKLLTGGDRSGEPRQRTLNATVAWSYSLLGERERVVLRRLSVFAGGWSVEAAEAVCAGDYVGEQGQLTISVDEVLESLTQLVNQSLLQLDQGTNHYRMLETIRLFGLQRLAEAGERDSLYQRHCAYYLRLAEDGASHFGGYGQQGWLMQLEHEHDNLRAALGWVIGLGHTGDAARLGLSLCRFWQLRAYQVEGLRWLQQIRALEAVSPLEARLRPRLLSAIGSLATATRQFDLAETCQTEALRLWTHACDHAGMAIAWREIGWLRFDEACVGDAISAAREALAHAEQTSDEWLFASVLHLFATASVESGQVDAALPALERSSTIWRSLGDLESLASSLAVHARAFEQQGDFERAKPVLAEVTRTVIQMGNAASLIGVYVGLLHLAMAEVERDANALDAARIFGLMIAWEEMTSAIDSPWLSLPFVVGLLEHLERRLGQEAFDMAVAEGKRMTPAGFLALVDRVTAPTPDQASPPPAAPPAPHDHLTAREREVLGAVAKGLTNAQVAQELTITPRTVNAHLTSIYGKLGVTSRSGAIRYAVSHQLG